MNGKAAVQISGEFNLADIIQDAIAVAKFLQGRLPVPQV